MSNSNQEDRTKHSGVPIGRLLDRTLRHPYWTAAGVLVAIVAIIAALPKSAAEPELLCRYAGARTLGWPGSGHKTNFCKNVGYNQGNFNIPGSGYGPGGICIDMASEPCYSDYVGNELPNGVRCVAEGGIKNCYRERD